MRIKSHLPPGRPPDGSFRRPEPRPPDPSPSTNPDPRPHPQQPISRPATLRPSRWPRFLLILFISISHAAVPKVTGPVVELTGQTLQGAVRDLSEEGSAQAGLSNSRYLTTYGVAFSQDGRTVYVGEAYKNRVLAVDVALGTATTVAGGNRGLQDGPTHTAKFSWPYGVALSPNSNTLYVADSGNDCIRAIALDAGLVSTIAGGGTGSRGFQDGPAAKAKFAWPYGVATSPDGHTVYVADSGNNRVRSIDVLLGTVSTLAGTGIAGYQDGAASAARFYGPRGVAASPDGSLVFVADYSNFRVRTLELGGADHGEAMVSTLFGGKGEIYRPAGVAVTSNGEWVLAADSANAKIRGVQLPQEDSHRQPPPSSHHPPLSPGLPPARGSSMGGVERLDVNTSRWTSPFNGQGGSWGMASGMGMGSEIEEMHIRHAIMAIGLFVVVALMGAGALVAAALYGRRNALRELSQYKSLSLGGGAGLHPHHLSSGSLGEMHRSKHHTVREYAEQSRRASYEDRVSGDLHHNGSIILDMPQDDHVVLDMGVSVDDLLAGMEGLTDRLTAGSSPPGSSGSRSPGGRSVTYGSSPPRGYNPLRPEQTSAGSNFSSRRERESLHVVRRTASGMMPEGSMSSDSLHRGVLQHQRSADGTVFRRSNY